MQPIEAGPPQPDPARRAARSAPCFKVPSLEYFKVHFTNHRGLPARFRYVQASRLKERCLTPLIELLSKATTSAANDRLRSLDDLPGSTLAAARCLSREALGAWRE